MKWHVRPDDPAYEELLDEQNRVVAAFGPNPYGMMGQNYRRAWIFNPATTNQVGTAVFMPNTPKEEIRQRVEEMAEESRRVLEAKKTT